MPYDKRAKVKFKTLSCGFESMESHNRDDTADTCFCARITICYDIFAHAPVIRLFIFFMYPQYILTKKSKILSPVISQANYCVLLHPVHSLGTCVARFIILKRCECNECCHNRLEIIVKIFGPVCSYFRLK